MSEQAHTVDYVYLPHIGYYKIEDGKVSCRGTHDRGWRESNTMAAAIGLMLESGAAKTATKEEAEP